MRDVQKCYRNHMKEIKSKVGEIDFIALSGHVCRYAEPQDYNGWKGTWENLPYPLIPRTWAIKAINDNWKKSVLNKLRSNMDQYDGYIVGTDSDQEGYGIYYLLEQYLGIQKKPALRFMEHSLTDAEIYNSLMSMTDFHKDPVHIRYTQSFLLRSQADWLFGMNGTCLMTVKMGELMTIGRVKAPTLRLVYENSMAIESFRPEKYYQIAAYYPGFTGICIGVDKRPLVFQQKAQAEKLIPSLAGKITEISKKIVETRAPKLYDLTALQGDAGQLLGLTPSETLETVQSLYEKHKVISYPRTQCRFVSSEKAKEFPQMLKKMEVFSELKQYVSTISKKDIARVFQDKAVVNDSEIAKESHDALLPTANTPNLSKMTERERNVCRLIYMRLLAQFLPFMKECQTNMFIQHGDMTFSVKGKIIENPGWRRLYGGVRETKLPDLKKGVVIHADQIAAIEKTTTPPKRLTQTTLVLAMKNIANKIEDKELKKSLAESQGIGTPATRDQIVKELIQRGYISDRKGLYITDLGKTYVEKIKDINIGSPIFAAKLDMEIKKIQRGEAKYEEVYRHMLQGLKETCLQIENLKAVGNSDIECPNCREHMRVRKYTYDCPCCGLKVNKEICGQKITKEDLSSMINGGCTRKMDFIKKNGTHFQAYLKIANNAVQFGF